ncbi:hypothetical protein FF2_004207 [Malus domestica]
MAGVVVRVPSFQLSNNHNILEQLQVAVLRGAEHAVTIRVLVLMVAVTVDRDIRVLIDSGAIFSFVSPSFAWVVNLQPTSLRFDMFIQMPPGDLFCA